MPDSFFVPDGDGRWLATDATVGPWSTRLQHGGPPAALLVRESERAAAAAAASSTPRGTGRTDLQSLRVVVDFLGPAPVGPVEVSAAVLREGRSAVLVEAELSAAGRPALRSRTWLLRRRGPGTQADPTPATTPAPTDHLGPDDVAEDTSWQFPYARHLEWRPVSGDPVGAGPAATWVRPRIPLVPDEPLTGLQRVVLVADSASGISAELAWDEWSFVNVDLSVHLSRSPDDDWLLLDARTTLDAGGNGLATSVLSDRRGPLGRGAQTLVVQPLP